jgi:hypothetical protein
MISAASGNVVGVLCISVRVYWHDLAYHMPYAFTNRHGISNRPVPSGSRKQHSVRDQLTLTYIVTAQPAVYAPSDDLLGTDWPTQPQIIK